MRGFYLFILIHILIFKTLSTCGQGFTISPARFDFGSRELWNNPPAVFQLTNTGKVPLTPLRVACGRKVAASFDRKTLQPGESTEIILYYYSDQTGPFSETADVYLSTETKSVPIQIRGFIKSIANSALTECPTDFGKTNPGSGFVQYFNVVDSETNRYIPGATIRIGGSAGFSDSISSGRLGALVPKRLNAGLYSALVEANGYISSDTGFVVRLNKEEQFVFRLRRLKNQVTTANNTVTVRDTVLPVTPPSFPDTVADDSLMSYSLYKLNNIVFLLDVSGSMKSALKLPLLKRCMKNLIPVLRDKDRVSLIRFSVKPDIRLRGVSGTDKAVLLREIDSLNSGGMTNGIKGLTQAYELADQQFIEGGSNLVIVGTDGMFAEQDEKKENVQQLMKEYAAHGIRVLFLGFGKDEAAMEMLKRSARSAGGLFVGMDASTNDDVLLKEILKQSLIGK